MVKRLIVRMIIEVASSLSKSILKAYQETAKKQGASNKNPFTEFVNQAMQSANLMHRPMMKSDAIKILSLENKEVTPEQIIGRYHEQFTKNDPQQGGSFYLQSIIHNAKLELMKEFPEANEQSILEKLNLTKPGDGKEEETENKDQKQEEKKGENEKEQKK